MAYCIMRVEKRSRGAVYGVQLENNRDVADHVKDGREFKNSKIDWALTNNNINLVRTQNWNQEITKKISDYNVRERKNSIVMLDAVYTASPEFFVGKPYEDIRKFFKDCLDFHVTEFCHEDKNLVLNAVIHFDESTPHLHIASIPIVHDRERNRLSARDVMGNRQDYTLHQDMFWAQVGTAWNLERGDRERHAKHLSAKEYGLQQQIAYAEQNLQKATAELDETNANLDEFVQELERTKSDVHSTKNRRDQLEEEAVCFKNLTDEWAEYCDAAREEMQQLTEMDEYRIATVKAHYPEVYEQICDIVEEFDRQNQPQKIEYNDDDLEL